MATVKCSLWSFVDILSLLVYIFCACSLRTLRIIAIVIVEKLFAHKKCVFSPFGTFFLCVLTRLPTLFFHLRFHESKHICISWLYVKIFHFSLLKGKNGFERFFLTTLNFIASKTLKLCKGNWVMLNICFRDFCRI